MTKTGTTSTVIDERITMLKKKLCDFFSKLPGNFLSTLDILEQLMNNEEEEEHNKNSPISSATIKI